MKQTVAFLVFIIFAGCKNEHSLEKKVLQGNAFGTTYTIQYFTTSNFEAQKQIDSVLYRVNKSMSTYIYQSDISKINRGDSTIVVDALFKDVWQISEIVHKNSLGYFSCTHRYKVTWGIILSSPKICVADLLYTQYPIIRNGYQR